VASEQDRCEPVARAAAGAEGLAVGYQPVGAVSEAEQERLGRQGRLFARLAAWTLDMLDLRPGRTVLELGCGGGGLLVAAAERVGPSGRVVGVERDPRLLAEARSRASGYPWIELVEADALDYDAGGERFDAVHCRDVVVQQAAPDGFVAHMVALTQPDGHVAAQEYDTEGSTGAPVLACFPPFPPLDRIATAVHAALALTGVDPQSGRKIADQFRRAGLGQLQVEAQTAHLFLSDPHVMTFLERWFGLGPLCERTGTLTVSEFAALLGELQAARADPAGGGYLVRLPPMLATVGRKGG